jgi:hypothetical protein
VKASPVRFKTLICSQVYGILLWAWLGGKDYNGGEVKCGRLLTIEELGEALKGMLVRHPHAHIL